MSELIIDGRPVNLYADNVTVVDSDVYKICDRIREVSPDLYIVYNHDDATGKPFAIMEKCIDGVDRLVFKTPELDGRVIEKLQYLRSVPFEKRFAEAEKKVEKDKKDFDDEQLEKLYDEMGIPMRYQLWHDGFIDHRNVSYPKRGPKRDQNRT
jgi:hypothetical protein